MSAHRLALALPVAVAAAAACLVYAGAGLAATSSFSGSVPNGGCDGARPVPVSGPSRIEIQLSSTSADNSVVGEILTPSGTMAATGSYDTPGGGNYSVRVCSMGSSLDPAQIRYSALVGTGPAGQPVLTGPPQPMPATETGGVLGVTATVNHTVSGKGAITTQAGLAWFTLHAVNASATLRVYDPVHHVVRVVKGLHAAYGSSMVRVTGNGLRLVIIQSGTTSRIIYSSPSFKASGRVVRGHFQISV
jgi:hypothetical protein